MIVSLTNYYRRFVLYYYGMQHGKEDAVVAVCHCQILVHFARYLPMSVPGLPPPTTLTLLAAVFWLQRHRK